MMISINRLTTNKSKFQRNNNFRWTTKWHQHCKPAISNVCDRSKTKKIKVLNYQLLFRRDDEISSDETQVNQQIKVPKYLGSNLVGKFQELTKL